MSIDIDQLRKDVILTADREGWSQEETRVMGGDIKAMIDRDDQEALEWQARYFAWWREMLLSFGPRLRAAEAGVKEERRCAA